MFFLITKIGGFLSTINGRSFYCTADGTTRARAFCDLTSALDYCTTELNRLQFAFFCLLLSGTVLP
jgi:hypothetical protein